VSDHTQASPAETTTAVPADLEAERLAAIRRYEILDAPADGTFDDIVTLAAAVFDTPVATVSIVDTDRVFLAASHGLDGVHQVGTEPGLCVSAMMADGPYVIDDAAANPRTLDHPLVRGQLGIRFYAAAPIITAGGHRLGTVNVMDYQPRQVSDNQITVLAILARIVARHLDLRLAALSDVRIERQLRTDADQRDAASAKLLVQLREAAAAHATTERPPNCELGGQSTPCTQPAELKIADGWGDSAWGCLSHVEGAITRLPSVYLADREFGGLGDYLNRD
jgi:phosphoserine phosphatase RsbU/P